jgi:O-methyltransferase
MDAAARYIDLLKRCVGNFVYADDGDLLGAPKQRRADGRVAATGAVPISAEQRRLGRVWPARAHTMIGQVRLDNLQYCVEMALRDGIPGDLIETGAWRGGACILMRGILAAHDVRDRVVWVADSFAGLPRPDRARYPAECELPMDVFADLAVSAEVVRENFARYGLLDAQVRFLEGWFRDTLPNAPIERLAVLRLDGDLYESTMDALVNLYGKLSPGGFVIVDDFGDFPACEAAVNEFRAAHGIADPIVPLEGAGAWWRRAC